MLLEQTAKSYYCIASHVTRLPALWFAQQVAVGSYGRQRSQMLQAGFKRNEPALYVSALLLLLLLPLKPHTQLKHTVTAID